MDVDRVIWFQLFTEYLSCTCKLSIGIRVDGIPSPDRILVCLFKRDQNIELTAIGEICVRPRSLAPHSTSTEEEQKQQSR